MKFRIKRQTFSTRIQAFLCASRYFFFIIGILALSYCSYVLLDAKLYQAYQARRFQHELKDSHASNGNREPVRTSPLPPLEGAKPAKAESLGPTDRGRSPLGRIEISTIGLSAMILEGIDERTLRRAVGHIPGTPLPGQPGNVALAGHRDTFFRALRYIREGDEITLETLGGLYRYRVVSTKVVDPGETRVLDNSDDAILTLVTCYPFSFVGSSPKRFVVRAHKLATTAAGSTSAEGMAPGVRGATTVPQKIR
jgi:sortase A